MPLIYIQRYVPLSYFTSGAQYVGGDLTLNGTPTIYLSESIYSQTGDYILFDYASGRFLEGQPALDRLLFNDSELNLSGVIAVTDDPANSRVILSLGSKSTNGTQYIEGDLAVTGPITMYLNATLYATPQTYILFQWTGTFTGNASDITCYPLKSGLSVVGTPYVDGTTIKVQLA